MEANSVPAKPREPRLARGRQNEAPTRCHEMLCGLPIVVTRKAIRHLYLRVQPPEGEIHLSLPFQLDMAAAEAFIASRLRWIAEKQEACRAWVPGRQAQDADAVDKAREDSEIFIWGKAYRLQSCPCRGRRGSASLMEGEGQERRLLLRLPEHLSESYRERLLQRFFQEEMAKLLLPMAARCEEVSGLRVGQWRLRRMKSRWGSCQPRGRVLTLNCRLVHYAPEILEYVVYHELTHLLEIRHNERFYRLLSRFCPDWRERRAALRKGPAWRPDASTD